MTWTALVVFLIMAWLVWSALRGEWWTVTGQARKREKRRARAHANVKPELPKRPSAFDPASETAKHLTVDDMRFFNRIARMLEYPEPYPYAEDRTEENMRAAGYVRTMPDRPWESISGINIGTWYMPTK